MILFAIAAYIAVAFVHFIALFISNVEDEVTGQMFYPLWVVVVASILWPIIYVYLAMVYFSILRLW